MPFIIDVDKLQYTADAYKGPWGTQCVALAQMGPPATGSQVPPGTSQWRRGLRVANAAPGVIQKGTVIATFTAGGRYPNSSEGNRHTALYLSHDANGIKVIEQWIGKAIPSERTLAFVGFLEPRRVDKGDQYYVVELTESEQIEGQTGVAEQTLGP